MTSAGDPGALAGLLDREAVRDLIARYAFAVDDHDLDALAQMFHPDAVFDRDGHLATGWPEIAETLGASMRGFQRMIHTPHALVVELTGADTATGASSGHGELITRRGVVLAAYRYRDEFVRHEGRWVFAHRAVRFLYATSADAYAATLAEVDRVRFPGDEPRPSTVVPRQQPPVT
ncbi:nuclear transport factor 2 family protein [Nocardioides houyundeii]|uniref:nuclear transport factor 2 family protein n=1 Tax=Nocardioides houyundeii TaxID=2045452 RepID=UPI000DF43706|nr:nuclear transport factor 2 family protein [Nocardioides houyundeii]